MDWNFSVSSGSWLEARQNPIVYIPIVIGLAAIAVFLGISIVSRLLKKYLNLPGKEERQRNQISRRKNIRRVALWCGLSGDEITFLTQICKKHQVPNVEYFFNDAEQTYKLFQKAFDELYKQKDSGQTQVILFSLLQKINKYRFLTDQQRGLRPIPMGRKVFFVNESGKKNEAFLIESDVSSMIFTIPKDEHGLEYQPPELAKINLFYQGQNDIAYTIAVRVMRYQERLSRQELVVTRALASRSHLREEYVHISSNIPCSISAVRMLPEQSGWKHSARYEPEGEPFNGRLINFSGETCNIAAGTSLPIQQHIVIEADFGGPSKARIVAVITNVAHSDKVQVLHAKYVDLDEGAHNYIFAWVYDFIKPVTAAEGAAT